MIRRPPRSTQSRSSAASDVYKRQVCMEDVLDVYHAPYDPQCPLICMDESNKQLVGEVHAPLAPAPGRGQIIDHEYVRNGVAEIFLEVEPLTGRRHVAITEHRTRKAVSYTHLTLPTIYSV